MPFFTFSQNNSGGFFTGPAKYVIIEALDMSEADDIAERNDLYFNGCESGWDCSCCGDRWGRAWGNGTEKPEIHGKEPGHQETWERDSTSDIPRYLIIYADNHTITGIKL